MLKQWKSHNLLWNLPRDSEISNCASGPAAWSTPKRRSDSTTFPLGGSAYGPWFWWPFPWWRTFHQPIWVFPKNRVGGKPHYFRFNIHMYISNPPTSVFPGEPPSPKRWSSWDPNDDDLVIFGRPCHRPMGSNRTQGNTRDFDAKKRNNRKIWYISHTKELSIYRWYIPHFKYIIAHKTGTNF